MNRAGLFGLSAVLLVGLGPAASAADMSVVACKAVDAAGGSNQLSFALRDGRVQAFQYRRSQGAPRCEIEASRAPSAYPWERSEWIDNGDASEVHLYSDDDANAHVRISRSGTRIELRVVDYDRWWHCGAGQHLHPVISLQAGEDTCILEQ